MKICPTCNAVCFDDMMVCYGCLHDFRKETALPQEDRVIEMLQAEPVAYETMTVPAIAVVPDKESVAEAMLTAEVEAAFEQKNYLVLRVEVPKSLGALTIRCEDADGLS